MIGGTCGHVNFIVIMHHNRAPSILSTLSIVVARGAQRLSALSTRELDRISYIYIYRLLLITWSIVLNFNFLRTIDTIDLICQGEEAKELSMQLFE